VVANHGGVTVTPGATPNRPERTFEYHHERVFESRGFPEQMFAPNA
jgi:hypothetical protein